MSEPTPRVLRLREHALAARPPSPIPEAELIRARAWLAEAGEPWTILRRAKVTAAVLRGLTPAIDPDELLVGKPCLRPLTGEEESELSLYRKWSEPAAAPVWGQRAHMAIDFDKLLRLGLAGLRQEIKGYRRRLDITRPEDLEKEVFYQACQIALDGLQEYAFHYSDRAAAQAAEEADPERRAELDEIAGICRRVPEGPATTFREAIQAAHFVTYSLCAGQGMLLFQFGRPDRYLLPFYRRDMSAGRITRERALELIDCLGLLLSEYTPRSLAVGWMVGGRDASGTDVCNELTELFIECIGHIRLPYPGVGLCWTPDTPRPIMELAGRLLCQGLSHPALFNDLVITEGLLAAGLPPDEACLYQNSTCVEITPIASSNVYVASPYVNLVQLLHDVLGLPPLKEMRRAEPRQGGNGHARESLLPANFEELLGGWRSRLRETVRQAVVQENTNQATRRYQGGFPLLSCFVNDCLAKGQDIDHGGARYNWIEPSFVGLSNLVDSLVAIRKFVYEEQAVSLEDLVRALVGDFAGQENLRLRLLNRAPKYGNDDPSVDVLAKEITGWIAEEVQLYRTFLGGRFLSGFFCWIMHEQLGRVTTASADGRRAGFPLGDGSGPAQGRERLGPTAAVLSTTCWEHSPHLGGIALNLKFSRPRDSETFLQRLIEVVETYLQRGGFEVQVNVVDKETLLAAQAHPELYRDLVVRIGGYSDYFVGLSPEMQAEILLRTEHAM